MPPSPGRIRVLFVGEGATLAHAARPMALAAALPADRFDVAVAVPERYHPLAPAALRLLPLDAQSPELFERRLRSGRPLFSLPRLQAYARADAALLAAERPRVVVGDLRLSLAASARAAGVPYIAISNAYWSPDRPLRAERPSLDLFRGWPPPLADAAFALAAPAALRWHARPVDRLLRAHGLPGVGRDLRRAFIEADLTLYADLPTLFPGVRETAARRFLGPVLWEPPGPAPSWWDDLPADRPLAYVTLGSSGEGASLAMIVAALLDRGFAVMAATAGRAELASAPGRVFTAPFLPGAAASRRAALVVCNGGSPTASQALAAGRPVLGVVSNLDQVLNMRAVERAGAGHMLRSDGLGPGALRRALSALLAPGPAAAAQGLASGGQGLDPARILARALERLGA